ncbi:MAG: rhomboid family intramembrane serine protease [Planctomycetota bacterium]
MADPRMDWEIVYRSPSETDCREHALVLRTAGIAHEVRYEDSELTIRVAASDADRSRAELDAYANESRDWPTARLTVPRLANGWAGVLCYATVLSIVAVWQQQHSFGLDWLEAGKTHAGLIRQGEWWRTVTALTLHNNIEHLLANVVIGGLVGLFAGRLLGSGRAWFCILIGGALGNLLNAWLRQPGHTSVGASTAVFAALGLLAGHAWRRRRSLTSRMERWVPLVGGVLLLSYLGTSGERTDIAAHVFGFLCGALLGALCGKMTDRAWSEPRAQIIFGSAALTILAIAWALASI